jgi:hypothetical protein
VTGPQSDELVTVHLLALPVPIAARARQHFEELVREFTLIAASRDAHGSAVDVPGRLMQLVDVLTTQFSGVADEPGQRLIDAIDAEAQVIDDHVMPLPPAAGPASAALGQVLEDADAFCRDGQELLTLATPDDCVLYRRWYLSQVTDQLAGAEPVSWPEYEARHRS